MMFVLAPHANKRHTARRWTGGKNLLETIARLPARKKNPETDQALRICFHADAVALTEIQQFLKYTDLRLSNMHLQCMIFEATHGYMIHKHFVEGDLEALLYRVGQKKRAKSI